MLDRRPAKAGRVTLGADKAYDVSAFVGDLRRRRVTPHIAVNGTVSRAGKVRKTAIDKRATHHPGDSHVKTKDDGVGAVDESDEFVTYVFRLKERVRRKGITP